MIEIGKIIKNKKNSNMKGEILSSRKINNIPHYDVRLSGPGKYPHKVLLSEYGIKMSYFYEKSNSNK
tara:strand:+ start:336 stop:536 length:201 start_codon:yes stop_codon:yes gene_type:complete